MLAFEPSAYHTLHFVKLMVMMELEVARATLNLQAIYLMLATHIIPMMVIIKTWLIELMDGILRDGDLICSLAMSLNTLSSLKH